MTEKQYLLKPCGLLDRAAADRLIRRIEDRARVATCIELDCSGVSGVLFEALQYFHRTLSKSKSITCRLELLNLPDAMAVQCSLLGWEVQDRGVLIHRGDDPSLVPDANAVLCLGCENSVRVSASGNYACPHCNAHFYVDESGHASFYEKL